MSPLFKSLITLVLVVAPLAAKAQFELPLTQPRFILVTNPLVRQHLKMTPEQTKKVDGILESVVQRDGDRIMLMVGPQTDQEELDKSTIATLDDKQKVRFEQLWLQTNGMLALSEEKTAKSLGTTEGQGKKLSTLFEDFREKMKDLFMSHTDDGTQIAVDEKKMAEMKKDVEVKISAVLTEDQRKKWKDMLGEAFDFEKKRGDGGS